MAPIIFTRTARLTSAAATITLSNIPQTAKDLLILARVRFDTDTTNQLYVGLRLNGDSSAVYRSNSSFATNAGFTTGITGDGYNTTELIIGEVNEAQANTAGMFATFEASIMRYAQAEPHAVNAMGSFIFDDGNVDTEYRRAISGGYHNSSSAVTSLQLMNETGANFAVDSEITVIGFAESGDAVPVARSTQSGTVLDFAGDLIKDYAATAGANAFTASSAVLGRTIQLKITGGDGTTTIGFPANTDVLSNNYSAGQDAWLHITCVDAVTPAFTATLRDII